MADNTQYQDENGELDVPEQPLSQDYDTPAAPADDTGVPEIPVDHPLKDSDVDDTERYDAGETTASGSNAQHEESAEDEKRIA